MNKIPIYKDKFQWGGTEGFKNQNIKLVQGRQRLKYVIEELFGMNFVRYLKFLRSRSKLKKSIRSHNLSKRQLQKCGSLAIIFIGSGDFVKFFPRFYTSFKKYFLPETKLFFRRLSRIVGFRWSTSLRTESCFQNPCSQKRNINKPIR